MEDIYKAWVDFGVDGFRIDTVKHVNMEFWQKFSPAMLEQAKQKGNDDFFMFGEVFDSRPSYMSTFTTTGKLPATLDFGFQAQSVNWVAGQVRRPTCATSTPTTTTTPTPTPTPTSCRPSSATTTWAGSRCCSRGPAPTTPT